MVRFVCPAKYQAHKRNNPETWPPTRPGSSVIGILDRKQEPASRQTHVKDMALWFGDEHVHRQGRTCGDGVVDFRAILPILAEHRPNLNLSIENPNARGAIGITEIYDPIWTAAHPDLTVAEFAAWIRLIKNFEKRVERGETVAPDVLQAQPFGYDEAVTYISDAAAYMRGIITECGLPGSDVR